MMVRQFRPHEAPAGAVFFWIPPGQYFPAETTRQHAIVLAKKRRKGRYCAAWAEVRYGDFAPVPLVATI